MVKKVQIKFWLIAMAAMGLCVVALICVINVIHGAQVNRQIDRALSEMVETVEAVQGDLSAPPAEEEPRWRVESYVEEAPQETEPPAAAQPSETPAPAQENPAYSQELRPQGDMLPGKKKDKKQPWWYEDFLPEGWPEAETTPSATAVPSAEPEPDETVVNHYYYYYPVERDEDVDLRDTAMNQYSGRLCVVSFTQGQEPLVGMSDSNALSEEEAVALAEQMRAGGASSGDLDAYRYQVKTGEDATWVYFLDCSTERQARRSLLLVSILVGLGGLLVTGVFVYFMSRKAIEPLKESMEKQKRFITDAGHELKTPLAVIGTNMDILEMDVGKNEWVDGTKKQLTRLRKLVTNLISLSRLEEMQEDRELQAFNLSETAAECADAFAGPAELAGRPLILELQPGLTALGDVMTTGQLLTILCDNAVKYAEGDVHVRLYPSGRRVIFETENEWDHAVPAAELSKLFDRFYRGDSARSGENGRSGYGLGLSIAQAIADQNKAQLTVEETPQGTILFRAAFRREK